MRDSTNGDDIIHFKEGGEVELPTSNLVVSNGDVQLANAQYLEVEDTNGDNVQIAGLDGSNDVYVGDISNAGGDTYIQDDGTTALTLSGGGVTLSNGNLDASGNNVTNADAIKPDSVIFNDANSDAGQWRFYEQSSGDGHLRLKYDGNNRLRVLKNGGLDVQNGDLDLGSNDLNTVSGIYASGNLNTYTDGSGTGAFRVRDSSNSNNILITAEESGPIEFRNSVSGDDILRMNASGGSNVEIPNGYLQVSGQSFFVDHQNDKVGIGTTSPSDKLVVAGNATIQGTLDVEGPIETASQQQLEVNASLLPPKGYSEQFDVGNGTRRWRNANFSGTGWFGDGLTVSTGTVNLPTGEIDNSELSNTDITINTGSNLTTTNGPSVSLGDSITIDHADTSSQADMDLSDGSVVQDVFLDGKGHVTTMTSKDLDDRYYTETESDANFVDEGDTELGNALVWDSANNEIDVGSNSINDNELAIGGVGSNSIANGAVNYSKLDTDVAGSGLSGGGGNALSVVWSNANDLGTGGTINDFSAANDLDSSGNIDDFSAASDLDSSGDLNSGVVTNTELDNTDSFEVAGLTSTGDVQVQGDLDVWGNITNTDVNNLNVNGSLLPPQDYSGSFDVGESNREWRNARFSGTVYASSFQDTDTGNSLSDEFVDEGDTELGNALVWDSANNEIDVGSNSINDNEIASGGIGSDSIASSAVTSTEISDGTIASGDIGSGEITSTEISDGTITSSDIGSSEVTSTEINSQAVGQSELNTNVAGDGLTGGGGSALSVNSGNGINITGDSVTVATDSIDDSEIVDNGIGSGSIGSGAVGSSELASDAVTSGGGELASSVAGSHLSLNSGQLDVSDDWVDIGGDTMTGSLDIGSYKINVSRIDSNADMNFVIDANENANTNSFNVYEDTTGGTRILTANHNGIVEIPSGDLDMGTNNIDRLSNVYSDDGSTSFFGDCGNSDSYIHSINSDGSVD